MIELRASREEWVRRAGPFYVLLVAAGLQTRLPLATGLSSSDDDGPRGALYLPLIGLGLGTLAAFIAAICSELGLGAMVGAVVVSAAVVLAGGGWAEAALASWAGQGLVRWRQAVGAEDGDGSDQLLTTVVIATLAILARVACIASISTASQTSILIGSLVLSRWTFGLRYRLQRRKSEKEVGTSWSGWLWDVLAGVTTSIVVGACLGAGGIVLMALALLAMWLHGRHSSSVAPARAVSIASLVELVALLL